jgi:CDP-glycerol glycerophosphotransferase (TagB/SpsB family)
MKQIVRKLIFKLQHAVNTKVRKRNQVLICEPWNIESNCVEIANYMVEHYNFPVYYAVPNRLLVHARNLVSKGVQVIDSDTLGFKYLFLTSKYIFAAHWMFPKYYTKDQVIVNLWHGVGHKKIALLRGKPGLFANYTVATSVLTQKAFTESFGNPMDTVLISGYPRNDMMLKAYAERDRLKKEIEGNLSSYNKILIWLPTFRTDTIASHGTDGVAIDNPFQIADFNVAGFNDLLRKHNVLCVVKPHPLDVQRADDHAHSNIMVVNDEWLWKQKITLYHLVACADIVVSDVSSIIVDYMLLDKPVICFSTDFDDYEASRGFYFEDMENWLPSKLIRTEPEFLSYLDNLLLSGEDLWETQRLRLKDAFFAHHDANSSKRLLEMVFQSEEKMQLEHN